MRPTHNRSQWFWLVGLLTAGMALAGTPAGTRILNQAMVEYLHPQTEQPIRGKSNEVMTMVKEVCAVSITPIGTVAKPGQVATILSGENSIFRYSLINGGNHTFSFPLKVRLEKPSDFSPVITIHHDQNKNGQIDANEKAISKLSLKAEQSAHLLVMVKTKLGQKGAVHPNLVTQCKGQPTQAAVAQLRVSPPPQINVVKTFEPTLIRPGRETTVTLTAINDDYRESREVILTDLLTKQISQGMKFVPNSAVTNIGRLEFTSDSGSTWNSVEMSRVNGLRVRVPKLAPRKQIKLSFRLLATVAAENKVLENVASARTSGLTTTGRAKAEVKYSPNVAIGPEGKPEAPEGTPADSQSRDFAVVGKEFCLNHTLKNTGDVQDQFKVTVKLAQGAAQVKIYGKKGTILKQPIQLKQGEEAFVRICYVPTAKGPLKAEITAKGARGTSNTTTDLVGKVTSKLPVRLKSVVATSIGFDGKPIVIPPGETVSVGDQLSYGIKINNPYSYPLTQVVVRDSIHPSLNVLSVSDNGILTGKPGRQVVEWKVGTLPAKASRSFKLVAEVSDRSVDGEKIINTFELITKELPPQPSNPVENPVWNAELGILKKVSNTQVSVGERLTYTLSIKNESKTTSIESGIVTDIPAKGLIYIPGTSTREGRAIADPRQVNGTLQWPLGELVAQGQLTYTYQMRVSPGVSGELQNTVSVTGTGKGGAAKAIASNKASAKIKVDPMKFAPVGDIVGVVFVDQNRNRLFDKGIDQPIERSRVIMAGGRMALTDAQGRYHFAGVPYGTQVLRVDTNSTPYEPVPQFGYTKGTAKVHVRGLTTVHFPLKPVSGAIEVLRRTVLTAGDVKLEKIVSVEQKGRYVVRLKLTTPRPLSQFKLEDPLPKGAILTRGSNVLSQDVSAGETNIIYRFNWKGEPRAATTDPVMSWRY